VSTWTLFSSQVPQWPSKTCPSAICIHVHHTTFQVALLSFATASKSTSPHRQMQCTPEPPRHGKNIPKPCMHNRHPLALASHQPSLLHRHLAHQIAACSWRAQVFLVALVTVRPEHDVVLCGGRARLATRCAGEKIHGSPMGAT
jgi:hypothetical protein